MSVLPHPRELRRAEQSLLEYLLSADFPGKQQLQEQSKRVQVWRECDCGCGTVDFRVAELGSKASAREPIAVEAYGDGVDVLLFVRGGYLESMEVVHHGDPMPGWYPDPQQLELWVPPGAP